VLIRDEPLRVEAHAFCKGAPHVIRQLEDCSTLASLQHANECVAELRVNFQVAVDWQGRHIRSIEHIKVSASAVEEQDSLAAQATVLVATMSMCSCALRPKNAPTACEHPGALLPAPCVQPRLHEDDRMKSVFSIFGIRAVIIFLSPRVFTPRAQCAFVGKKTPGGAGRVCR
jgi:hypothetical protein